MHARAGTHTHTHPLHQMVLGYLGIHMEKNKIRLISSFTEINSTCNVRPITLKLIKENIVKTLDVEFLKRTPIAPKIASRINEYSTFQDN